MNREQQKDIARAFLDGEQIQIKSGNSWLDVEYLALAQDPRRQTEYRVKPEPRVFWVYDFGTYLGRAQYATKEQAQDWGLRQGGKPVKFVEVIDE